MLLLISDDIQKCFKTKICSFYGEFVKEQKKGKIQKTIDLPEHGFKTQIFSNFPPMIGIFIEGEVDKIKSKQNSKRDTTLCDNYWLALDFTKLVLKYSDLKQSSPNFQRKLVLLNKGLFKLCKQNVKIGTLLQKKKFF